MSNLKDLLDETAGEAEVYDVTERALAGGRRRRVRQRLTAAGSAAITVVAGIVAIGLTFDRAVPPTPPQPAASVAPRACEVARLPVPAGSTERAALTASDPSGRFLAGHSASTPKDFRLLLWDNGQVRALEPHGDVSAIVAVNSHGHAVETTFLAQSKSYQSWVYHDGGWTQLKGQDVKAVAVNDNGIVVGTAWQGRRTRIPVIWRSYDAEPVALPLPEDNLHGILGIDRAGNVAALVRLGPEGEQIGTLIWPLDGQAWQPYIAGFPDPPAVNLLLLHNGQLVVAAADTERASRRYWTIDLRTRQARNLDLPMGVDRLSANGWALVGAEAALHFGDVVVRLPDLTDKAKATFTTMSADGRVIGGRQGEVAAVWRCR